VPREVAWRAFNVGWAEPLPEDVAADRSMREVPAPGERIRLARAVPATGIDDAAAKMSAPGFDPVGEVVVESEAFPPSPPADGRVDVEVYAYERIRVRARSSSPCALFLADSWDPGWKATLDGAEAALVPADVAGRALALPAGEHWVELRYRAPGLRTGVAVSLAWLFGTLAVLGLDALRAAAGQPPRRSASAVETSSKRNR
jgi:hypothetical protein